MLSADAKVEVRFDVWWPRPNDDAVVRIRGNASPIDSENGLECTRPLSHTSPFSCKTEFAANLAVQWFVGVQMKDLPIVWRNQSRTLVTTQSLSTSCVLWGDDPNDTANSYIRRIRTRSNFDFLSSFRTSFPSVASSIPSRIGQDLTSSTNVINKIVPAVSEDLKCEDLQKVGSIDKHAISSTIDVKIDEQETVVCSPSKHQSNNLENIQTEEDSLPAAVTLVAANGDDLHSDCNETKHEEKNISDFAETVIAPTNTSSVLEESSAIEKEVEGKEEIIVEKSDNKNKKKKNKNKNNN